MKLINDTHGHEVGDLYLCEVATRIRSISRSYDTLARLGGDEFVVLLSETTDAVGTRMYAEKLSQVLIEPLRIRGTVITPRASIGFACFPEDGDCADTLLAAADAAMYAAKQSGGNRVHAAIRSIGARASAVAH